MGSHPDDLAARLRRLSITTRSSSRDSRRSSNPHSQPVTRGSSPSPNQSETRTPPPSLLLQYRVQAPAPSPSQPSTRDSSISHDPPLTRASSISRNSYASTIHTPISINTQATTPLTTPPGSPRILPWAPTWPWPASTNGTTTSSISSQPPSPKPKESNSDNSKPSLTALDHPPPQEAEDELDEQSETHSLAAGSDDSFPSRIPEKNDKEDLRVPPPALRSSSLDLLHFLVYDLQSTISLLAPGQTDSDADQQAAKRLLIDVLQFARDLAQQLAERSGGEDEDGGDGSAGLLETLPRQMRLLLGRLQMVGDGGVA
jgi:hypothetical protein